MRIPLTKGYHAIVDDCDARVAAFNWQALVYRGFVYAGRRSLCPKRSLILLHRVVMRATPGEEVDHKNRNGLDNRRRNLRICTRAQNMQNSCKRRNCTSEFKGVSLYKGKWKAEITKAGRREYLGLFSDPEDAHAAYRKAARRLFGAFARAA